jgi:hypothetical protein
MLQDQGQSLNAIAGGPLYDAAAGPGMPGGHPAMVTRLSLNAAARPWSWPRDRDLHVAAQALRNVICALTMPYFPADPLDYATPSRSRSAANCSRFMMAMP